MKPLALGSIVSFQVHVSIDGPISLLISLSSSSPSPILLFASMIVRAMIVGLRLQLDELT